MYWTSINIEEKRELIYIDDQNRFYTYFDTAFGLRHPLLYFDFDKENNLIISDIYIWPDVNKEPIYLNTRIPEEARKIVQLLGLDDGRN